MSDNRDLDDRINNLLNFNFKAVKSVTTFLNYNGQRPKIIQHVQRIANWENIEVVSLLHVYEAQTRTFQQPALSGAAIALHSHASGASCLSGHLCHLQLSAPTCSVQDAQGRKMELPDYFVKFWKDYYDQSIG